MIIIVLKVLYLNGFKVDNLVLIATPNRYLEGQYQLLENSVSNVINVSNFIDLIQPNGGGFATWPCIGEFGAALQNRNEGGVTNIMLNFSASTLNHSYQNDQRTMDAVSEQLEP